MSTNTVSFAIPTDTVDYIDDRVATGGYGNRSEFIRELIRKDQHDQQVERLRFLVQEGLASGASRADTPADWTELHAIADGEIE